MDREREHLGIRGSVLGSREEQRFLELPRACLLLLVSDGSPAFSVALAGDFQEGSAEEGGEPTMRRKAGCFGQRDQLGKQS